MKTYKTRTILNKLKNNDQGSTMLETLVAFTVLMVILAIMYQMMAFSSDLRMKAADEATVVRTFNQELYRTGEVEIYDKIRKKTYDSSITNLNDGPLLYLTEVKVEGQDSSYTPSSRRIQMGTLEMDCFSFNESDEMITKNEVSVPKAVQFVHVDDR